MTGRIRQGFNPAYDVFVFRSNFDHAALSGHLFDWIVSAQGATPVVSRTACCIRGKLGLFDAPAQFVA
jgi:hypothetical protein